MSFETVKTYDADQVGVRFAGVAINKGAGATGYADGEFCRIEQLNPSFQDYEGTDGQVTRSKTNRRLTSVKIRLAQSSDSNAYLSSMLTQDELQPNGASIGTLNVSDLVQGTSVFTALKAWIAGPPVAVYDRGVTEREWEIRCVRTVRVDGGN